MKIYDYLKNQTIMDNEYLTQFSFFSETDKEKVEGMLKNFHGVRDLHEFGYYDEDDNFVSYYSSESDFVKSTVLSLFYQKQYEWEQINKTIIADYDFLKNMDLLTTTHDETDDTTTTSGSDTTSSSANGSVMPATTNTTETYQNAYDSSTPALDNRVVNNSSGETDTTSEESSTIEYGKTTKYDGESNVTVTQLGRTENPQELIARQREIARISLLRDITDSVANVIAYQLW